MGRMRLELQFVRAGKLRFRENMDKHAIKREGKLKDCGLIFCYNTFYNLTDLTDSFCGWLQKSGRRYKYVKDIPPKEWNAYLEELSSGKTSYSTLVNYRSRINTWEKIINAAYGTNLKWSENVFMPYKLTKEEIEIKRIQQMQREDYNLLMDDIRDTKSTSEAVPALQIAVMFGLRVEGTAKIKAGNVHLDETGFWGFGTVDINEKGNRDRTIDIRSEADRKIIEGMIEGKESDDRLVPIQKGSVNKFINRRMKKIGIKEKYPETSIHSFRKLYAQETWDDCRNKGFDFDKTVQYVNRMLGHGEERNKQLLSIYVKNMW